MSFKVNTVPNSSIGNKGRYEAFEFEPYVYHPYPKAVRLADGREVVAQDRAEELRLLASVTVTPETLDPLLEERNELAQAVAAKDDEIASRDFAIAELKKKLADMENAQKVSDKLSLDGLGIKK